MGDMRMTTLHLYGQVCCWGFLLLVRMSAGAAGEAQTAASTGVALLWDPSRDVLWCRSVCAIWWPDSVHRGPPCVSVSCPTAASRPPSP